MFAALRGFPSIFPLNLVVKKKHFYILSFFCTSVLEDDSFQNTFKHSVDFKYSQIYFIFSVK
jgi:hypothetical protein